MSDDALAPLPPEFFQRPLTARMLEDYESCPRKFLLSFVSTADDSRRLRGGAAMLHQAVRQSLLEMYRRGGPDQATIYDLLAIFATHWEGRWCADSLEEQQLHRAGEEMLRQYHRDHSTDTTAVTETDCRLTATIGDADFLAVADLVLEMPDQALAVQRFITARSPLSAAELRTDLSAQLLWLVAQESLGEGARRPVTVGYYSLRQARLRPVALDSGEAAYLRHDLTSRVARLRRDQQFTPRKGPYCRWCRSKGRCPLWQR